MNKVTSLFKLVGSNIKYRINGKRCTFPGKKIVDHQEAVDAFLDIGQNKNFQCAYIDETATLILYEGLLVNQHLAKDYSGFLYSAVSYKLGISVDSLSFKVLKHICSSYIQAFNRLGAAFIIPSRKMRYVIKCAKKGILYFWADSCFDIAGSISPLLKDKKVAVLSDHADLIKVQFVREKSNPSNADKYSYSLLAIDSADSIHNTDRSLCFETVDAISMKLLKFSFDTLLIHADIYSLPLLNFISKLKISCFIMDDSIYRIFNIARFHSDDQSRFVPDSDTLYLEDYDKESNPDFEATVFLSKEELKNHGK